MRVTFNRFTRPSDPQTGPDAEDFIAQMERETKSRAARKRMAEVAIDRGNLSYAAYEAWRKYLATFD